MTEAFVLVRVQPGKDKDVLEKVKAIEGVKEAFGVAGRFDVVVRTLAPDLDTLSRISLEKLRTIEGILYTETLVAVI